jgi:DNA repair exonuclease SbcCD ATPase subunit
VKIVALQAENIKHLKVVNIRPDGSLVVVGGDNEAGKSSLLDSIEYALGGAGSIPPKPIRDGKQKARVVVDLGDIEVTRTFTEKGTNLTVKNKDGKSFASPQTMLDQLVGELTFDPLEFANMDAKRQRSVLKKLVGLDFDQLDADYKKIFDERTVVNRRGKDLKSTLDGMERHDGVPDIEVSIKELGDKYAFALDQNQKVDVLQSEITGSLEEIDGLQKRIDMLLKDVKQKQKALDSTAVVDVASLQKQMSDLDDTNVKVRANKKFAQTELELVALREKSLSLCEEMSDIAGTKEKTLAKAQFPIEGLDIDGEGVTFDDLPFSQCSSGQKIKISVAIGLAMNPKLRVLLIREGSLLDAKNLEMVAKMAKEADAQIWIERVSKGSECSVIIEDGSVLSKEAASV